MHHVLLAEAVTRLPQLVAEAGEGEEVIFTQDSRPIARIMAVAPAPPRSPRQAGTAKGLNLHIAADFDAPLDDFKEYM